MSFFNPQGENVSLDVLQQLRAARAEVETHKVAVIADLRDKADRGEAWQAENCAAWSSYVAARQVLEDLRDKYEV